MTANTKDGPATDHTKSPDAGAAFQSRFDLALGLAGCSAFARGNGIYAETNEEGVDHLRTGLSTTIWIAGLYG